MQGVVISRDDPRADDVRVLLAQHLAFNHQQTPPEDVHALELDGLLDPAVTFLSARHDGELVAIGALRDLGSGHAEIKSMHTAERFRRRGAAEAMLAQLVALAWSRGYERLSLETGTMDAYAPARSLYKRAGFEDTAAFGAYAPSASSAFMTLRLDGTSDEGVIETRRPDATLFP